MSGRWEVSSADAFNWIGFVMCTLTQRELDFLASLTTRWQWLYWRELVRILKKDSLARKRGAALVL
ncbi:hypothetical protein [Bradyrhizobium neotropicale]|uniref:Uncharacterized protein n=1 Tax=Bradyrhizobium neotropicale TaxID=1497615 RepID=A0A176ZC52_9BRAD|nr:hypothetical protein [Bradyrhizobium neotropicale]OAF17977.1 hypothetical protein AXW67_05505 [Bradyrhizobium neotropicale]